MLLLLAAAVVIAYKHLEDQIGNDDAIRDAGRDRAGGDRLALRTRHRARARSASAVAIRSRARHRPSGSSPRLITLVVVLLVAFRLVDVNPKALAVGGALTVVIIGLAAQGTLGNLIAGAVLLMTRPFQIGERVRLQGSTLGGQPEGTVASIGLLYTTIARGEQTLLVPNNGVLASTIVPLHDPAGIDMRARLRARHQAERSTAACSSRRSTRRRATGRTSRSKRSMATGAVVRITATPVVAVDGDRLADEMLEAVAGVAAPS